MENAIEQWESEGGALEGKATMQSSGNRSALDAKLLLALLMAEQEHSHLGKTASGSHCAAPQTHRRALRNLREFMLGCAVPLHRTMHSV